MEPASLAPDAGEESFTGVERWTPLSLSLIQIAKQVILVSDLKL